MARPLRHQGWRRDEYHQRGDLYNQFQADSPEDLTRSSGLAMCRRTRPAERLRAFVCTDRQRSPVAFSLRQEFRRRQQPVRSYVCGLDRKKSRGEIGSPPATRVTSPRPAPRSPLLGEFRADTGQPASEDRIRLQSADRLRPPRRPFVAGVIRRVNHTAGLDTAHQSSNRMVNFSIGAGRRS